MKKLQLTLRQLTSLFPIYNCGDFTRTCFLGNFLHDLQDSEHMTVMVDDNYLMIAEDHGEIHLHGFLKNKKGAKQSISLNRTAYLWLPPSYQTHDQPTSQLLTYVKYAHSSQAQLQTNEEINPEDMIKIIRTSTKELNHTAFIKKIYSAIENKDYFAYSDGQRLRFVQIYDTPANSYHGLFFWSDLSFGESFKFFQMVQGGNYQQYKAWIRSDNFASIAYHQLSGYERQDVEACLYLISQR